MKSQKSDIGPSVRRSLWGHRLVALAGGCAAVTLALWTAGLPPSQWVAGIEEWFDQWTAKQPAPEVADSSGPTARPLPKVEEVVMPAGIDSSISDTPLALVLTGTIVGRNRKEGFAFIGVNATNPQTYVAQAILANGARIAEIHTDHVILERDGKRARLDVTNDVEFPAQQMGRRDLAAMLHVGGDGPKQVERKVSVDLVSEVIRTQPIYRQEIVAGFEVQPGRDSQTFRELGLMPGDVITSIDGALPADAEQMSQLLMPLPEGAAMTVSVQRAGKALNVSLDGRALARKAERASEAKLAQLTTSPPPAP